MIARLTGFIPVIHWTIWNFHNDAALGLTVYFDNLALLMLTLISFVGWVICQYSVRYLDGEATQGRYFRWTAFAIGSISWMVVSGNLAMFMVSWVMTSTALHKLLLHYSHRRAAQRAAWTNFAISRVGDVALVAAIVLLSLSSRHSTLSSCLTRPRSKHRSESNRPQGSALLHSYWSSPR